MPAPTPATPAVATAPVRPPIRGRRGHLTFSQQRLAEPLILEQVVLDPKWNWFKTYFGVCVGGFCFMAWVVYLSFQIGAHSVAPASTGIQQSVVTGGTSSVPAASSPVQQNTAPLQWGSYADCQRHYVLTLGQDPEGACDSLK